MKKIFGILVFLMLLLCAIAFAQGGGPIVNASVNSMQVDDDDDLDDDEDETDPEDGDESEDEAEEEDELEDENEDETEDESEGKGKGKSNKEQIQQKLEEKKQELEQEAEQLQGEAKEAFKNQNGMKLAVHALLELENRTGGIGAQVSAIAREFNNGINKTLQAEEKIAKRSALKRFFAGGDEETATELENEVVLNKEKIEKLKKAKDECTGCDEETAAILEEQIQTMEQEQERLGQLAEKEKRSKGVFGWLWK